MDGKRYITLENTCAAAMLIWGTFVANPYVCMFDKNPRLYAPMSSFTNNEAIWGGLYFLMGTLVIFLSFTSYRKWSSLIIGATYISLAVLFFMGDFQSAGWGFFGLFGAANIAHWLNTDGNRRRG